MTERKVNWEICECNEDMAQDAVKEANKALDHLESEKEISEHIKKHFDKKFDPNWHCVVGKNFASFVTYTSKHFIFFYVGQLAILLYKL